MTVIFTFIMVACTQMLLHRCSLFGRAIGAYPRGLGCDLRPPRVVRDDGLPVALNVRVAHWVGWSYPKCTGSLQSAHFSGMWGRTERMGVSASKWHYEVWGYISLKDLHLDAC